MSAPRPSPQFEKLLRILIERRPPPGPVAVDRLRARFDALALPAADDVAHAAVTIAGVPGEEVTAPGADPSRVVLYLHGGGYAVGSPHTHRKLAGDVSRAAGVRVLLPDYPLAPEHPFPAAIEAVGAIYDALVAGGTPPRRIALAGDSAGGGLAAAVLVALRERGARLPAAGVLISPWLDMTEDRPAPPDLVARDPVVSPADLAMFRAWYLGGADPHLPLASPVLADLRGLPPLLVQVGDAEILLGDARRFAERCAAAGVEAALEVWGHMIHVWQIFAGRVPEATAAVERIGAFLRARLA